MKKNHIMELLGYALIVAMLFLSYGCASKELIRTSLRPPPEASTDHHAIIAEQNIAVTVADNYIKKYDAGGQYVVHPSDWEAIMDELDSLSVEIDRLEHDNKSSPE